MSLVQQKSEWQPLRVARPWRAHGLRWPMQTRRASNNEAHVPPGGDTKNRCR